MKYSLDVRSLRGSADCGAPSYASSPASWRSGSDASLHGNAEDLSTDEDSTRCDKSMSGFLGVTCTPYAK